MIKHKHLIVAALVVSLSFECVYSFTPLVQLYENIRESFGGNGEDGFLPELSDEHKRQLQAGSDDEIKLCAMGFNQGGKLNHVVVNVDKANEPTLQWLPYDLFCVIIKPNEQSIRLDGEVVPRPKKYNDVKLKIDLTFKSKKEWDECYCASADFVGGNPLKPSYKTVQKECTFEAYEARDDKSLLFCPKCENNECRKANENRDFNGALQPIYAAWEFYAEVEGGLSGPGLQLFLEENQRNFPEIESIGDKCTFSNKNMPLAQFSCSDLDDSFAGYGYGANTKNQHCGFATWFNCQEELKYLGGDNVMIHVADINFDLIPCPTPKPTKPPGEECPTTKDKCKFYENDAGTNFCSDIETCPPSMIWDAPNGENKGLGCSNNGGNERDCGCCRVPPPTPQPTSPTTGRPTSINKECPETPEDCKCFENEDCSNFCSDESSCLDNWIWDEDKKCSKQGDNEKICRCCRKPPPTPVPTSPTTARPTTHTCPETPEDCACYENEDCTNYCSDETSCRDGWLLDKDKKCSKESGNDKDCMCCRKPPPTPFPTPFPSPAPTEQCPTTKDKCKFYKNNAGTNFCSDIATCPPAMIWESPNGENKGLGCSKSGGNQEDCGCCRTPEPTSVPTPFPSQPDICKVNVTRQICVDVLNGTYCPASNKKGKGK